jgi:hypothetical protein
MDYVVNSQTNNYPSWISNGNNFLQSTWGILLYVIVIALIVIVYYIQKDPNNASQLLSTVSNISSTNTDTSSPNKFGIFIKIFGGNALTNCKVPDGQRYKSYIRNYKRKIASRPDYIIFAKTVSKQNYSQRIINQILVTFDISNLATSVCVRAGVRCPRLIG